MCRLTTDCAEDVRMIPLWAALWGTIQSDPANAVLGTGFLYSHLQRSWLQRSFDALGACTQGRLAAGEVECLIAEEKWL